jgi:6,7-dimethyl-8-ribityllumazine synthase
MVDSLPQVMSKIEPRRLKTAVIKRVFAIVASRFNEPYVDGLVRHAQQELAFAAGASVSLYRVSGAFEIPIVVRELAMQRQADAIIALGVILKGETGHADNLASSVTNALQQIALEHGVPVLNGVLSLEDETQAEERCLGSQINRGTEAARAAIEVTQVLSQLRRK